MSLADYYSDTDPRALEMFVTLQRERPASQKIADVFGMSTMLLQLSLADVRRMFPEAGDREVFLRMAARHLDRDMMIRVYGWDPES
jgi:hypothetical protein